jgi:biotin-(acetyl-CoA carboxylase) ligase
MKGIDETGRLILEDREGKVHSIDTGEVVER